MGIFMTTPRPNKSANEEEIKISPKEIKQEKEIKINPKKSLSIDDYLKLISQQDSKNLQFLNEQQDIIPWLDILEKDKKLAIKGMYNGLDQGFFNKKSLVNLKNYIEKIKSNVIDEFAESKIDELKQHFWHELLSRSDKSSFFEISNYLHFLGLFNLLPSTQELNEFILIHPECISTIKTYDNNISLDMSNILLQNISYTHVLLLGEIKQKEWLQMQIEKGDVANVQLFLSSAKSLETIKQYSERFSRSIIALQDQTKKGKIAELFNEFKILDEKQMLQGILKDTQSSHNIQSPDRYLQNFRKIQQYGKDNEIKTDPNKAKTTIQNLIETKLKQAYKSRDELSKKTEVLRKSLNKFITEVPKLLKDKFGAYRDIPQNPYALLEWLLNREKIEKRGWKNNPNFKPNDFFTSAKEVYELLAKELNLDENKDLLKEALNYYKYDFDCYQYSYAKRAFNFIYPQQENKENKDVQIIYKDKDHTIFSASEFFSEIYTIFTSDAAMPKYEKKEDMIKELENRNEAVLNLFISMGTSYNASEGTSLYPHDTPAKWDTVERIISCPPGMLEQLSTLCTNPDALRGFLKNEPEKPVLPQQILQKVVKKILMEEFVKQLDGYSAQNKEIIMTSFFNEQTNFQPIKDIKNALKAKLFKEIPQLTIAEVNQYNLELGSFLNNENILTTEQICGPDDIVRWQKKIGQENLDLIQKSIQIQQNIQGLKYLEKQCPQDSKEISLIKQILTNYNQAVSKSCGELSYLTLLKKQIALPKIEIEISAQAREIKEKVKARLMQYKNISTDNLKNTSLEDLLKIITEKETEMGKITTQGITDEKIIEQTEKLIDEAKAILKPYYKAVYEKLILADKPEQKALTYVQENLNQLKTFNNNLLLKNSFVSLNPIYANLSEVLFLIEKDSPLWTRLEKQIRDLIYNDIKNDSYEQTKKLISAEMFIYFTPYAFNISKLDEIVVEKIQKYVDQSSGEELIKLLNPHNKEVGEKFGNWAIRYPALFQVIAEKTKNSSICFYFAIIDKNEEMLDILIKKGLPFDKEFTDSSGKSSIPLYLALLSHPNIVEKLLAGHASPNTSFKGIYPLFYVFENCSMNLKETIKTIDLLLKAGADPALAFSSEQLNKMGAIDIVNLFESSINNNWHNILSTLILNSNVDILAAYERKSILEYALNKFKNNELDSTLFFTLFAKIVNNYNQDLPVGISSQEITTLFCHHVENNNIDALNRMLKSAVAASIDKNIINEKNILYQAVKINNTALVDLIIKNLKIDINKKTNNETPLQLAIKNNNVPMTRRLAEVSDITLLDNNKKTIFEIVKDNNKTIKKILEMTLYERIASAVTEKDEKNLASLAYVYEKSQLPFSSTLIESFFETDENIRLLPLFLESISDSTIRFKVAEGVTNYLIDNNIKNNNEIMIKFFFPHLVTKNKINNQIINSILEKYGTAIIDEASSDIKELREKVLLLIEHSHIKPNQLLDIPETDKRSAIQKSLLNLAVQSGDEILVKKLLVLKPELNTKGKESPIQIAIKNNYTNIFKLLFENGAKLSGYDALGNSPLKNIVMFSDGDGGDHTIINFLISKGIKLNELDSENRTLLHFADDINLIKKLIENGADIYQKNTSNVFPITNALRNISPQVVKLYLEKMDFTKLDPQDCSRLLQEAITCKSKELIEILLNNPKIKFDFEIKSPIIEDYYQLARSRGSYNYLSRASTLGSVIDYLDFESVKLFYPKINFNNTSQLVDFLEQFKTTHVNDFEDFKQWLQKSGSHKVDFESAFKQVADNEAKRQTNDANDPFALLDEADNTNTPSSTANKTANLSYFFTSPKTTKAANDSIIKNDERKDDSGLKVGKN